jgi:SAM-dependent methyltransferase
MTVPHKKMRDFWEKCKPTFSHVKTDKLRQRWYSSFHKNVLQYLDLKDKVVIDYGIGSGHLGLALFNRGIKKYVGIDIAQRSLDAAIELLGGRGNMHLTLAPVEFMKFNADIFISLACIQHFPTQEYLDDFLRNIVRANIPVVFLQIRRGKKATFSNSYKSFGSVRLACITNAKYISKRLPGYELTHHHGTKKDNYQFLKYELASGPRS